MARNLYDVGDRTPDEGDGWLIDKQEKRAKLVPIGMVAAAIALAIIGTIVMMQAVPASGGPAHTAYSSNMIADEFALCDDTKGQACVLTADTYAWRGQQYHLADIRAPSEIAAQCPQEAARARKGRFALMAMMNGGAFQAVQDSADSDPSARILMRDGVSIGQLMILKSHAKPWSRDPVRWCASLKAAGPAQKASPARSIPSS
jgi:hypothetical protein